MVAWTEQRQVPDPSLAEGPYSSVDQAELLTSWMVSAFLAVAELGVRPPAPMVVAAEFLLAPFLDLYGHQDLCLSEEGSFPSVASGASGAESAFGRSEPVPSGAGSLLPAESAWPFLLLPEEDPELAAAVAEVELEASPGPLPCPGTQRWGAEFLAWCRVACCWEVQAEVVTQAGAEAGVGGFVVSGAAGLSESSEWLALARAIPAAGPPHPYAACSPSSFGASAPAAGGAGAAADGACV